MKRAILAGLCAGALAFGVQGCGDDSSTATTFEMPEPIAQTAADTLIGLSESGAKQKADDEGWGFRVGRRDNEAYALTADYSPTRVTVEIDNGKVTKVTVG